MMIMNTQMLPNEKEVEKRLEAFETVCRKKGLRVTEQRREIFRTVASSREHPCAEKVCDLVRKKIPHVSLDTVYRTLSSLEAMELLVRVGTPAKERFDGDLRPHAHFVCTRCGEVYDIFSEEKDAFSPVCEWGEIKQVNVQFRGICNRCQKKIS
ncbi:MAG: transcriptional repressor [Elusimicrobium sp.]|uniref:Transcriptional repressor n=1 Tax=Candidatus Avelusimicrobium gallicola TaxID=2562704 RepID=A0A928DPZ6_9BACT|nr:transcriptional repressor [Elusimicrobium sp.]